MAKKVVQTAAVHVEHVPHLSSRALRRLGDDFRFPPELNQWLSDATQVPGSRIFGTLSAWRGRWPMLHPVTRDLVGTDITVIVGDRLVAVLDAGDTPWVAAWMKTVSEHSTDEPWAVARSLVMHLVKSSTAALNASASVTDVMRQQCAAAWSRLADDWSAGRERAVDGPDALLVHSLRHADRLLPIPAAAAPAAAVPVPHWMRLASSYAIVSGIALLTILLVR